MVVKILIYLVSVRKLERDFGLGWWGFWGGLRAESGSQRPSAASSARRVCTRPLMSQCIRCILVPSVKCECPVCVQPNSPIRVTKTKF